MALPAPLGQPRNVYQAAADYRSRLLSREQGTVDDLTSRWIRARAEIDAELDALTRRIEAAVAMGKVPGFGTTSTQFSVSWLYRVGRLENLSNAITQNLQQFTDETRAHINTRVGSEAVNAATDGRGLMQFRIRDDGLAVPRQFAQLPDAALEKIISFSGEGGPLPLAFRGMGDDLVREVQQRLVDGLAKGANPREIARKMQAATIQGGILDRPLYEQMRVARTEPLRAYREVQRETYKANADVVLGWEWHCFPSRRTCPFCLAMDGTRHSSDEVMATHPLCRCSELPITELSDTPPMSGALFLYNQAPEVQDEMLGGHTMGELYRAGKVQLSDIPTFSQHPKWGRVGHADSMKGLADRGIITNSDIAAARSSSTKRPVWVFKGPSSQPAPTLPPAPKVPKTPPPPKPKAPAEPTAPVQSTAKWGDNFKMSGGTVSQKKAVQKAHSLYTQVFPSMPEALKGEMQRIASSPMGKLMEFSGGPKGFRGFAVKDGEAIIPVKLKSTPGSDTLGAMVTVGKGDANMLVGMQYQTAGRADDAITSTALHENAHVLDYLLAKLKGVDGFASVNSPDFEGFRQLVNSSKWMEHVAEYVARQEARGPRYGRAAREYANYLTGPHECFARALQQWLGEDYLPASLTEWVARGDEMEALGYVRTYWKNEDFKPIKEELQRILRSIGVLQ
jgi:SPP1 gp7 family putative phage head morphogenesis protein